MGAVIVTCSFISRDNAPPPSTLLVIGRDCKHSNAYGHDISDLKAGFERRHFREVIRCLQCSDTFSLPPVLEPTCYEQPLLLLYAYLLCLPDSSALAVPEFAMVQFDISGSHKSSCNHESVLNSTDHEHFASCTDSGATGELNVPTILEYTIACMCIFWLLMESQRNEGLKVWQRVPYTLQCVPPISPTCL